MGQESVVLSVVSEHSLESWYCGGSAQVSVWDKLQFQKLNQSSFLAPFCPQEVWECQLSEVMASLQRIAIFGELRRLNWFKALGLFFCLWCKYALDMHH